MFGVSNDGTNNGQAVMMVFDTSGDQVGATQSLSQDDDAVFYEMRIGMVNSHSVTFTGTPTMYFDNVVLDYGGEFPLLPDTDEPWAPINFTSVATRTPTAARRGGAAE